MLWHPAGRAVDEMGEGAEIALQLEDRQMRDLQYMIDVMTAARDGKRIEFHNIECDDNEPWHKASVGDPLVWNWPNVTYRVAPEPRKARVWWYHESTGCMQLFHDRDLRTDDWILVREVLPE